MGIWSGGTNGTDTNSVDRNPAGTLVATAEDSGAIKLFNFPCVVYDAPHRAYAGHAAHVTCVRFNADGTRLVSTGGADRSVMQFCVAQVPQAPPPTPRPERVWGTEDGKVFGWAWKTPPVEGHEDPSPCCGADRNPPQEHVGEGDHLEMCEHLERVKIGAGESGVQAGNDARCSAEIRNADGDASSISDTGGW